MNHAIKILLHELVYKINKVKVPKKPVFKVNQNLLTNINRLSDQIKKH